MVGTYLVIQFQFVLQDIHTTSFLKVKTSSSGVGPTYISNVRGEIHMLHSRIIKNNSLTRIHKINNFKTFVY